MRSTSMLPAIRGRLVALVVVLAASYAVAQQSPAPAKSTDATVSEEAAKKEADAAAGAEGDAQPSPAKPASAKGSPQRFEPTEKVRADFDVAFPVDI